MVEHDSNRYACGPVSRGTVPKEARAFVASRHDVHAVVQRIGADTFDLVLVDADGNWDRWVVPSEEAANGMAEALGVTAHDGWTDDLSKRMNRRDHWNAPGGQRRAL
jgi:hypothetical protein